MILIAEGSSFLGCYTVVIKKVVPDILEVFMLLSLGLSSKKHHLGLLNPDDEHAKVV
jgi:hypothetical protein